MGLGTGRQTVDGKLVPARYERDKTMPSGLWLILAFIAVVIVYTIAKVRRHMRESEEQWEQVDKSKLREWEDDD